MTTESNASSAPEFAPAITWLNMSGDVTITWDNSNREAVIKLVEEKMKQGYSFFVITPRFIPIFGNKKVALTDPKQLQKAVGVVAVTEVDSSVAVELGDKAVSALVKSGNAAIAKISRERQHDIQRRAKSAKEVLTSQTVAVRPIVGG